MIKNQRVFWSGQYLFPDSDDPGDEPDVGLLEGTVTFAPVWDAGVSGLLSDSQRSTYVKPFPIEVRDGQLMSNDDGTWIPGAKIPASIGGHPLAWVARFDLSAGGEKVTVRELKFTSNPDGEVHLHNVIPAEAIYPQLPPDIVKGDSVTDIYTQGQYVVFIVGDPPRTRQYVLAFPGTADAVAAAEAAVAEFEQLRDAGVLAINETRTSAETAITQTATNAEAAIGQTATQAQTAITQTRDEAVTTVTQAKTSAETAINQTRTNAEASLTQTRTDAEASVAQTLTEAEKARDDAEVSRDRAHDSEVAAGDSARDAAADLVTVGELKAEVDTSRNHVDQKVQDFDTAYLAAQADMDNRVAGWGTQFDQDLLTFQGLKVEMQNIATDVAADVAHLDGIVEHVDDALDVVRAHRWVPRGEWDAATAYVAGDMVVFDDGSYYASADIPVGTEPPGGQWVVFGQGGISDASELSGKLGPLVDASGASVDLSAEVGVPPEMHDALLHELLGVLVRDMDATVDADRVEGGVTAQLDLSNGMVTVQVGDGPTAMPLSEFASGMYSSLVTNGQDIWNLAIVVEGKASLVGGKVPLGQLPGLGSYDAADLTGALTDQVDAGAAMVEFADGSSPLRGALASLFNNLMWLGGEEGLGSKADLDSNGKLDPTQLPALAITEFLGTAGSQAAMLALSGQRGDWCVRTDRNTQWILIADNPAVIGSWREMVTPAAPVSSVAGRTGAVTLSKSDVGLANADNTSDLNKPISNAVSAALGTKAASDHTHSEFARVAAAPATWHWAGTSLPTAASQVHAQARVGDFIVAPNLTADPGWHRITGV